MSYYLAPSLEVLRSEINQRWPGRDKTSDGWIGDLAHQATRSDHNPNSRGSVDALDVDRDGVDMTAIIAAFQRHPSAHYWIYRGQIADRDDGWRRRTYTGTNPHDKHAHFSIRQTRTAEQDRRPWGLLEDDMSADDATVGFVRALNYARNPDNYPEPQAQYGRQVRGALAAIVESVLEGRDFTDEPAIIAGVLAGLPPEQIAAAIPPALAREVADELARRLAS